MNFFENVKTGYSPFKEVKKNCIAFGFNDYGIFCDYNENQIIKNIWFVFSSYLSVKPHENNYDNLIKAFIEIGTKWNLILVDWNEEFMVILKISSAVNSYLLSLK